MRLPPVFRNWRLLAGAGAILVTGYVWGHLAVTRDIFPYPQIAAIRAAASGETIDERPAYERDPPLANVERATLFAHHAKPADLVIVGDSILARVEWRDLLPQVEVANRAIAGDYAAWLPRRLEPIIETGADEAFILIGINDAVAGRSAQEIHGDIARTAAVLRRAGMGVTILSPLPCGATATHCGEAAQTIRELNRLLAENSDHGARYLDVRGTLAPQGALLDRYSDDGVHLNLEGIEVIAGAIGAASQSPGPEAS